MSLFHSPSLVTSGLVLCLDAGNPKSYPGSGTTWTDLSGNGNSGTLINGPTFNSANSGSLLFDGVNDYVNGNHGLTNNADFSVSFWLYYISPGGGANTDRGLITTWDASWNGFGIGTSANGTVIRSWARNGAAGGMNWGNTSTIRNVWSNLILTYTYSTRTQSAYVNTTFVNSEVMTGSSVTHSNLQVARGGMAGSVQLYYYPYLNANFGLVSIYSRALSAAEVQQNFNALRGRYGI